MEGLVLKAWLLLAVMLSVEGSCPGNMELVNQKCYLFGVASSREDAWTQCTSADPNNHLWIINDITELNFVMGHFKSRLISPWAWTDGVKGSQVEGGQEIWEWGSTGHRMSYYPDVENQDCDGKCVADDCGINKVGDCATLSMNDREERSYQGCDCETSGLHFICESPDESNFDCPEDGFFPSDVCSDLWYNCYGGHATPEYCADGLVFNPEVGYCDFPANVDGC